jgi:hypothetical protein
MKGEDAAPRNGESIAGLYLGGTPVAGKGTRDISFNQGANLCLHVVFLMTKSGGGLR